MCVGGYNHVAFYGNMAVVVLVFAELRWRRWLCAKKPRRGTAMDKKKNRLPTREGARRGRAGAMRVVHTCTFRLSRGISADVTCG